MGINEEYTTRQELNELGLTAMTVDSMVSEMKQQEEERV